MSDHLYPTRLVWDGRRGIAKHDGVSVILHRAPNVLPDVSEIHYVPAVLAEIRPHDYDRKRDMEPFEIVAVKAWLDHIAKAVHRLIAAKRRHA